MLPATDKKPYLNLACGTRMHPDWINVDFSPYAKLARRPRVARLLRSTGLLSRDRYDRLLRVDPSIVCHNLLKKLPFPADTFEVVYHSHFLEHLNRSVAPGFLKECHRVLRPNGILRIALPDLRKLAEWYLESFHALKQNNGRLDQHSRHVDDLFDQMVRVESDGARNQRPVVRFIQRVLGQDAKKLGEAHQWMYDFYTLKAVLEEIGFHSVQEHNATSSNIPNWTAFTLDTNADGSVYKPESLFIEARK